MAEESPRVRRNTATSAFGASRREGHDSSAFYARFGAPQISADDTLAARADIDAVRDRIFNSDARDMSRVPSNSVGLVVTSPPYFAGKAYEEAMGEGHIPSDYMDYLEMLRDVFAECQRVLEPGGRIVVNVANLGRRPFRSLAADVTAILQDDLGMLLRGEIVWLKQRGASGNCAWGSYRSPTNPVLRDTTERLVVASKGRFDRAMSAPRRLKTGLPSESTIPADEFLEATLDVWEIQPQSATRVNHPAPFPASLVERCVHLYSFAGDLILDPFMGSGSTAVAARRTGRSFVGFEIDPEYVRTAEERVASDDALPVVVDVRSLHDIVDAVLIDSGFSDIQWGVRVGPGLEISGRATSPRGRVVHFDLAGGNTAVRPGLQRGDVLWRATGRASSARAMLGESIVVFTSGMPERASGGALLESLVATGAIVDVIDVAAADVAERLRRL